MFLVNPRNRKMIAILRNLQKTIFCNEIAIKEEIEILRSVAKITQFEVTVCLVENKEIQEYNRRYRGLNKPTDVLAFPFNEYDIPGNLPLPDDPDFRQLGDIVLGLPYIQQQCVENNEILDNVLPVMVTHGLCHLMGYDHETKEQWQNMYNKEMDILSQFNKITGKLCKPLLSVGHL